MRMLPASLLLSTALLAVAAPAQGAVEVTVVPGATGARGLLVDGRDRLLFSDGCGVVREAVDGQVRRVAGIPDCDGSGVLSAPRFGDAADPLQARLGSLVGLGRGGRDGEVLLADTANHRIRVLGPGGVTTVAGTGTGFADGGFADGPVAGARLNQPAAAERLRDGGVVVADAGNGRVRLVAGGTVTTLAGGGPVPAAAGVRATDARFGLVADVAVLPGDGVAFTDAASGIVWRVGRDGRLAALATGLTLPFGVDARGPELVVGELGAGRVDRIGADGRLTVLTDAIPTPYAVAMGACPSEVYVDSFAPTHPQVFRLREHGAGCGGAGR